MNSALLTLIYSSISGAAGIGLGWFLRGRFGISALEDELSSARSKKDRSQNPEEERARTAALMAQLAELTTGVAFEVGKHSGNIEAINAELAAAKEGDTTAVLSAVKRILDANDRMQQQLHKAETRLQDQQRELAAQTEAARTDQLTRITNRRAIDEELHKCLLDFERIGTPFCIMMLDVDHFKKFNDTHGHLAGDEVLRFVAQLLHRQMRSTELVGRYGGEEFLVLFRGETVESCKQRADAIRESIGMQTILFDGKELHVAASAGIASVESGDNEKMLIKRADEALYISKKAGRNCAHWNDGQANHPVVARNAAPAAVGLRSTPGLEQTATPKGADARTAASRQARFELYDVEFSDSSFCPNIDRRVAEWKRSGKPFSVAVIAIDDFPAILQTTGPDVAREVIGVATGLIRSTMRDMDHMARFGDSGFALFLPTAEIDDAAGVAERVRKTVQKYQLPGSPLPKFTVCAGVAQIIDGNDSSRLFDRALRALESAQEAGPNNIYVHDGMTSAPVASTSSAAMAPAMA